MTTYYVAMNGRDSGNGSSGSPWRTISKAMKANLKSGDEVVVRSGTYKEGVTINKDGITLRSEVPGGAKIDAPSGKFFGIHINADRVEVEGFEVYGAKFGIGGHKVHHVKVTNNEAHDNTASGISFAQSEFLTIEGNVTHGNASSGYYSGISILRSLNITGDTKTGGFRTIVRDNVSYDNVTRTGGHTDGNGIIIDDFQGHHTVRNAPNYTYPTLVEGNIAYSNGGRGIQVAYSDNVTVRDNIAWHNNTDNKTDGTWRGELSNQAANNNTWIGNIGIADTGINRHNTAIANVSYKGDPNQNVTWSGNVTYNGRSGDDSLNISPGNSSPSPSNNKLGNNPNLSLSELKSMAAALSRGGDSRADAAEADFGTSVQTDADKESAGGVLDGGPGNDRLEGGSGHDKLLGGRGEDTLTGNAGADDFVFNSIADAGRGGQRDAIRDFSHRQGDEIDLRGIDADTKASGNQSFSFIGSKAFSGDAGELQYKNGIVAGDVNGDRAADFHIEIANHHGLGAGDFLL